MKECLKCFFVLVGVHIMQTRSRDVKSVEVFITDVNKRYYQGVSIGNECFDSFCGLRPSTSAAIQMGTVMMFRQCLNSN